MTNEQPDTLRDAVREIVELDVTNDLIRSDDLGSAFSFAAGQSVFEDAKALASEILSLPTQTLIGTQHHAALTSAADDLKNRLREVKSFDPNRDNPANARDELLTQVREQTKGLREQWVHRVGYLVFRAGGLGDIEGRLNSAVQEWETRANGQVQAAIERAVSATESAEQAQRTAQAAAEAAQQAATHVGVGRHAEVFEEEAKRQQTASTKWLQAAVFAAVVVGLLALALVLMVPSGGDNISDPKVVQVTLLKALVVGFGGYIVVAFFKMFRVAQHLRTVNNHRALALQTFETFAAGAHQEATRDAVLVEATRAVFSPGSTGMFDGDSRQSPTTLMEVFRQAGPPSS